MRSVFRIVRAVTMFGQLGFTLITPPVVMALLGWWLQSRYGLGTWVMLLSIVLGLLTSAASAIRFYRRVVAVELHKPSEEAPMEKPVVFYHHE